MNDWSVTNSAAEHRVVEAEERGRFAGHPTGPLVFLGLAGAHGNSVQSVRRRAQVCTEREPGLGAARAAAEVQARRGDTQRLELRAELHRAGHVAEGADAARAAHRNHVRDAAAGPDTGFDFTNLLLVETDGQHRIDRRHEVDAGAEEAVEQQIAFVGRGRAVRREHQLAVHAGDAGRARGHSRVVRLHGAGRDERGGAGAPGVADQVLQLASLVAAAGEAGEVVALDENSWTACRPAERIAQPHGFVERRRERGQSDQRPSGQAGGDFAMGHGAGIPTLLSSARRSSGRPATNCMSAPVLGCARRSRHACSA